MKDIEILEIPIEDIEDSPYYAREFEEFDEDDIKQLAKSFEKSGLLQPIVVRINYGVGKKYQLIAGKRRKTAFMLTGNDKILARIVEADDVEARIMSLAENYHRKDLTVNEKEKFIYKLWIYGNEKGIFSNFISRMEEWTGIPHQTLSDIINAEKEKELDDSEEIQLSTSKDLQRTRSLKDLPYLRKELLKGAVIKKTVKILEIADAAKIIKKVIGDLKEDILVDIVKLFTEKKLMPNNLEEFINIINSIPNHEDQERIIKKILKDSEEQEKINIYNLRRFVDIYNGSYDDVKSRLLNRNINIEEGASLNYFKTRDQREKILEALRDYDKEIKSIEREKIKYIKDKQKMADSFYDIKEEKKEEYIVSESEDKKQNKIIMRIFKIRKDLIFFNTEEINNYDRDTRQKAIEMVWEVYNRYYEILIELGEIDENIFETDDIEM